MRIEIIKNEMRSKMELDAMNSIRIAVKRSNENNHIAAHLRKTFEEKYGGFWTALVIDGNSWGLDTQHEDHGFIMVKVDDRKTIALFQVGKKQPMRGCISPELTRYIMQKSDR